MEIETAKLHGGWAVWVALPTATKATLLAHELHRGMRQAYEVEQRDGASSLKEKDKAQKSDWMSRMRTRFLGGGHNIHA